MIPFILDKPILSYGIILFVIANLAEIYHIFIVKKNKKIGTSYENQIVKDFRQYFPDVYQNVIIPDGKGGTTEIDMIIVTHKGLFCIECKHRNGNLFGSINTSVWDILDKHNHPIGELNNPLTQNYGHIQNLSNLLNNSVISNHLLYNIFVVNKKVYYTYMGNTTEITDFYDLLKKGYAIIVCDIFTDGVKKFVQVVQEMKSIYTDAQLNDIKNIIKKHIATKEQQIEHVKYVVGKKGE